MLEDICTNQSDDEDSDDEDSDDEDQEEEDEPVEESSTSETLHTFSTDFIQGAAEQQDYTH